MFSVFSLIRRQFAGSLRSLRSTQAITTAGLLLAIQMVLSSVGVIEVTDSLKISLAHLAVVPTAMLYGPVVACLQSGLSDILGFILRPSGPYFPGFTLTAALLGLIYGMFLYQTERKAWQLIAARLVVCVFVNILLNSVFLAMLYGPSRWATLPLRIFKNLVQLPVDCLLLSAMCRFVQRMPMRRAGR